MFDADWILRDAAALPDPGTARRPVLLAKRDSGQPIRSRWPVPKSLRERIGRYPDDHALLGIAGESRAELVQAFGGPGDQRWANAIATLDDPSVAIPLERQGGVDVIQFVRIFLDDRGSFTVASIRLTRRKCARGARTRGTVSGTEIKVGPESIHDRLREHLELLYLEADPNFRDRALTDEPYAEPVIWLIAPTPDARSDVKAAAATFGVSVHFTRENIARDPRGLPKERARIEAELAGVVLHEPDRDHRLSWVADQLRAALGDATQVERVSETGAALREVVRLMLDLRDESAAHAEWRRVPTCARCQPEVSRVVDEQGLAVVTVQAGQDEVCVCGGSGAQSRTMRLRFAALLAEEKHVLVVGYQKNFDEILPGVPHASITHLFAERDPKAAAERATLVVVLPGSHMGHSDSERYTSAATTAGRRIIEASGSEINHLIDALMQRAFERRSSLRRPRKEPESPTADED
jgi:hypothetical protein